MYVILLRGVNVGGNNKVPMADLRTALADRGLEKVSTYIASGNVVFQSTLDVARVKVALEQAIHEYAGKPVGIIIRTPSEMADVLLLNPFSNEPPNRVRAEVAGDPARLRGRDPPRMALLQFIESQQSPRHRGRGQRPEHRGAVQPVKLVRTPPKLATPG